MIAVIRIMMKDINIVAATALQAIDPVGQGKSSYDRSEYHDAKYYSGQIP